MEEWLNASRGAQIYLFGHTHALGHMYCNSGTHFLESGAGGGIQTEASSAPPPYARKNTTTVWTADQTSYYPYGFYKLSFSDEWIKIQAYEADDSWRYHQDFGAVTRGQVEVVHEYYIPIKGGPGIGGRHTKE
jgi:hypothetical protein